ncbi:Cthe_2314 family HEPN domain-containing protein [Elusimicrobiota bacterium]
MSVEFSKFPSDAAWRKIYASSPFKPMFSLLNEIQYHNPVRKGVDAFAKEIKIQGLLLELQHRLCDAGKSYVLMMFYSKQGIPDKRWHISPGSRGSSVEYFPDFEDRHFEIKGWFDFYADTLYYKLFSAWDIVGHILNVKCNLGLSRASFHNAVCVAIEQNSASYTHWSQIVTSSVFRKAKGIRHDITHNYLPSTTGMTIGLKEYSIGGKRKRKEYRFGMKKYLPSDEIVANLDQALDLFKITLEKVQHELGCAT